LLGSIDIDKLWFTASGFFAVNIQIQGCNLQRHFKQASKTNQVLKITALLLL